jgi:pyruvate/2-oxoglutarate dehydrogenase complex dihydrolipoamide dehydrogenase (E3) component
MMRALIPEYILPRNVLDAEIKALSKLGVEIRTQSKVESVDKLLKKGYDAVLLAIGGTSEITEHLGVKVNEENAIQVEPESLMTNTKGVFAGGDAVTRKSSFIEAVAAGRKAAISIDRYLGGSGDISEVLAPVIEGVPRVGRIDNFAQRQRQEMPTAKPAKQIGNFTQVELGFSDELGNEEAKRCMGCDLRFAVAHMVTGPEGKVAKIPMRT